MIGNTYGKTRSKKEERQHYAELLLEQFDYTEDLGYVNDNIAAAVPDTGTAYVTMNIRDHIVTDGTIDESSLEHKAYGINHQYETFELIVHDNPTYIIGMRKLEDGYIYKSLFADYTKIDIHTYQNILIDMSNLKRSIDLEEMNNGYGMQRS